MALLIRHSTAHANKFIIILIAAAGGCPAPFGDLGSTDLTTTGSTSGGATEDPTSGGATEDPTVADTSSGEPPGPPDEWDDQLEPQAGTRLRPILRTAVDGTTQHVAWHDTKEDNRCSFRSGDDGVRRCYPEPLVAAVDLEYADPGCTVPVLKTYNGFLHDIAETSGSSSCVPGTFYRLDPEPYAGTVYSKQGNGCSDQNINSKGYFKGTVMAHSEFVAAEVEPAAGTSRIVPLILAAEDGARAIVGAWDREHSEEVEARPGVDAEASRWFGRYAADLPMLFSDVACTAPLAESLRCTPPDRSPATAQTAAQIACEPQAPQRWRIDEPFTKDLAFQGDACEVADIDDRDPLWTIGEALSDEDFGLVTAATVGGTRLTREVHGNPEGEPFLGADVFFDPELGEPCRFRHNVVNNFSHCEPLVSALPANIYLDAACTRRVGYIQSFDNCLPPPANWAVSGGEVWPLVKKTSWGGFKIVDDECVPTDDVFDIPGGLFEHTVYEIGPAGFALVEATDIVQ